MATTEEQETEKLVAGAADYEFPESPFESIGLSFSGGGFRAASYALGTLSLLNAIRTKSGSTLLNNVKFISSASGGTLTSVVYVAALRKGLDFSQFFRHMNKKLTGEHLLGEALAELSSDENWSGALKARNPINAFARSYHNSLLDFLSPEERILGFIMDGQGASPFDIEEYCFNSSEFYTGLSFRFQGGRGTWKAKKGGQFGNATVGINWSCVTYADTLKKIRLSDIIAASSCFPLGFEPIMFPKDFTYEGGPGVDALKDSLRMDPYSWKEGDEFADINQRSRRAGDERNFTATGEFGLMDGGICDNQGLYSLLKANKRKSPSNKSSKLKNRFSLMLVSDVTSFYMKPFRIPASVQTRWNNKTPQQLWENIRTVASVPGKWLKIGYWSGGFVSLISFLPLLLQGVNFASVLLAIIGQILLALVIVVHRKYNKVKAAQPKVFEALSHQSLKDLFCNFFPQDSFGGRTGAKVVSHLQETRIDTVLGMLQSRAASSVTMISEVFLKHIRRLIYEQLFSNPAYKYRRQDNPIYALSYTNAKNRNFPSLSETAEEDDEQDFQARKKQFDDKAKEYFRLSTQMQDLAELAYNAPTTLWFTPEEESVGQDNLRKAIIATGQFTTCYNLLRYTMSLRYSKHFSSLKQSQQHCTDHILAQLVDLMSEFRKDAFYLYDKEAVQPS